MNNLLNIDFKELLPRVIEAFTYVYGKEYRDIIAKRLNSSLIIGYQNYDVFKDYLNKLFERKSRELAIKFLNMIGEDTSNYKSINYMDSLDEKTRGLIKLYLSSLYKAFPTFTNTEIDDDYVPIKCFKQSYDDMVFDIETINLINYLRGTEKEKIDAYNFIQFTKTDEYQDIYKKVCEYAKLYDSLLNEQREWSKQFSFYYEIIKKDKVNKESIIEKAIKYLIEKIFQDLPINIRHKLAGKPYDEIKKILLGKCMSYNGESNIESFSNKNMKRLKDKNVSTLEKSAIIWNQKVYLRGMGIDLSKIQTIFATDEDIDAYLEFINHDDIKKYIPYELIDKISRMRGLAYDETKRQYYEEREDFVRIKEKVNNYNDEIYNSLLIKIKDNSVCVSSNYATNEQNEFVPIIFYTLREMEFGILSHTFIHECGHAIDRTPSGCGFELASDFTNEGKINPYNKKYRINERFNEAINDIFTMKANEYLWEKGVYLIEPQEYTKVNRADYNTSHIVKELLYPLLDKFHKQVVRAKIYVDNSELTNYIGEDNFDDLVDVVNKVDNLVYFGLFDKLTNNQMDPLVIEYNSQLERLKKIYQNIDTYYNSVMSQKEIITR